MAALLLLLTYDSQAANSADLGIFSARIARIHRPSKLMRFKVWFKNVKFLNKGNVIKFWHPEWPETKCALTIKAVAEDYILARMEKFDQCVLKQNFTVGSYVRIEAKDLRETIDLAKELIKILATKQVIAKARLNRAQKQVATYGPKREAINKRYEILRQKLEAQWRAELSRLDEDRSKDEEGLQQSIAELRRIEYKMLRYFVHDHNLKVDRWSLDSALYYKK